MGLAATKGRAITYDIITVGGGLGGSTLARAMAEKGARVLVVEREERFKDRVRGEYISPWGVAEAKDLGIYELLVERCGHHPQWFDMTVARTSVGKRDLSKTTPQQVHALTFYHPSMQEVLLEAAEAAGVEVRRAVRVRSVEPGREPTVTVESKGGTDVISARLVVGADGRGSLVRKQAGFDVSTDMRGLQLAGLLLDNLEGIDDRTVFGLNPFAQHAAFVFPQGQGRARAYFGSRVDEGLRLQGHKDVPRFIDECIKAGTPAQIFETAEPAGPLATFRCVYTWVDHPYREGVALVGDSATTSDPTWGQGLCLTLGAVRRLRDALIANEDWDEAGHSFADAVEAMWEPIRTVEFWFTEIFMGASAEAAAARVRALPLFAEDLTRVHDAFNVGPNFEPVDEIARRRFFGEE